MRRELHTTTTAAALLAVAAIFATLEHEVVAQSPLPTAGPSPEAATSATPSTTVAADAPTGTPTGPSDSLDAERQQIWQSPDMEAAREYIQNYATRSVRFTPKVAAAYLAQLQRLSPTEMKAWLERFKAKQANLARSAEVAKAGRQMAVDQAVARQQARQQSYVNMKQAQSEAALANSDRVAQQFQMGRDMASARDAFRAEQATALMHSPDYSWIIDPPYYTRVVAAASLPGDLPRGDPSNFIRGDVAGPEVIGGEAAAASAAAAAAAAAASAVPP